MQMLDTVLYQNQIRGLIIFWWVLEWTGVMQQMMRGFCVELKTSREVT
ncbi:hypothetical protein SLEP1_g22090 [Rubroshorea leprosula]|uniref:Uncharacterized protein n=1 Tax=Rubroshorea leprosula TaxID=152421 RepID=A0AAV5JE80_9ROSI|nr:hypothetical protein SLEP1_g22090 [Rubroshorea leprosula]